MAVNLGAPIPGIKHIKKYPLRSLGILMICLSALSVAYYNNYIVMFLGFLIGLTLIITARLTE
jgi:hypothetical protein